MPRIGFIGLGRMGLPMASNLARKGFEVAGCDLDPSAVEAFVAAGGKPAASIAEAAAGADIVVTMLPASKDVESVALGPGGILESAPKGALVMDMSTIDPKTTDSVAERLAVGGLRMVDAPVGRLASHADRGESLFMVGASEADFEQVRPLLDAMGTTVYHCGAVGTGIRTKLVNNFLAIASCQMNAEALALAEGFGLNLETTLDVIHGTTATNGQLKINYATKVLTGDTEPGFTIDLAHKDLSLIVDAANAARVPLPTGASAREALSLARAASYGGKDFSALLDHWCERTGIAKPRFRRN